jgi:glycosyltransferase involved in cell wall biosynthesis
LKIAHISVTDIKGGAARAAYRLHSGLRQIGHDSCMLVAERASPDPHVMTFSQSRLTPLLGRLRYRQLSPRHYRYLLSRPAGYGPFTGPDSRPGIALVSQLPDADVLNLHRIADLLDYQTFFSSVTVHTPVVWTQHDMNAFTGGCAYNRGCDGFERSCGACPQLGSNNPWDLSYQNCKHKEAVFLSILRGRLQIVTPSRWMAGEVARSSLMNGFPVSVIPYGLNTQVFAPQDRIQARSRLGIPPEARVVLFLAASVAVKRKGFSLLAEALANLDSADNVFLLSIGSGRPAIGSAVPHLHLGSTNDDRYLAEVYSSADVFAIPSLQDNLPNTAMEALACGTPVVGFAVGGIPEMVRAGVTGLAVPVLDVSALRSGIIHMLEDTEGQAAMRARCRHLAVSEYSLEIQAERYAALYEKLVQPAEMSTGKRRQA